MIKNTNKKTPILFQNFN